MTRTNSMRARKSPADNRERLQAKIDGFNNDWDLLQEKLTKLRTQYHLENKPDEKLRIQQIIEDTEVDQKKLETKLKRAENQLKKEEAKVPAEKPSQPRKKNRPAAKTALTIQSEVTLQVREKVAKLLTGHKLRPLLEALVKKLSHRNHQREPENLLIPDDPSELDKSIRDLHNASNQCLQHLKEHNQTAVKDVVNGSINLLGWLVLLSVRSEWLEQDIGRLKRMLSSGYIEIPLKSETSSEVIIARLRSHAAEFTLEGDGIVSSRGRIKVNELERGFWNNEQLSEIKKEIWKKIFNRDPEPFEDFENELKHILEFRDEEGEHYHIAVPIKHNQASPDNGKLLKQLSNELPHLAVFLISSNSGEQILVMEEPRFHSLIREFLMMLQKYQ